MIKINWGQGIAIFFCFFVATLITVLVKSRSVDHTLVYDDYYAKDIAYQSRQDRESNTARDTAIALHLDKVSKLLKLEFTDFAEGTLHLYRADDKSQDVHHTIKEKELALDLYNLNKGKWTVILEWESGGIDYYHKQNIFL